MDLLGVPFEQGYLDAGGVKTRFLHAGQRHMPPLFFLHGTGGHCEAYARNLAAHGEHFSTWAIDMIGNGLSDRTELPLEIPTYVQHLKDVLDGLGLERVSLSGESLGGWVAARFALDYPERVERLVLNTPGGHTAFPEVMERIKQLSMASVEDPSWSRIRARLEFLRADKSKVNDDAVAVRQSIYARPGMVENMRRTLVLQDWDTRQRNMIQPEEWAKISTPTLVLWTSDDPTAGVEDGRRVAELIPGSEFVVMDGCGHWPQWEDPKTFNRLHLSFLLNRALPAS
jgi:2-hydroxy-6-oxonona-2,4-dienedioate hydrolase